MTNIYRIGTQFTLTHDPVRGKVFSVSHPPNILILEGFNLRVEVNTAEAWTRQPSISGKSISTIGHLDTGASRTAIDISLAQHLELTPTGYSIIRTAAGKKNMPNFTVDLNFIGDGLGRIPNIEVHSCDLEFDFTKDQNTSLREKNFGLLIGRDIMSNWSITWHGPTSTVFISD